MSPWSADTEKQRHQLFVRAEEFLGPDEAEIMMQLIGATTGAALVVKQDLDDAVRELDSSVDRRLSELDASIDRRLSALERSLTRTFVTWMLAGQTGLAAIVALIVTTAG